MGDDDTVFVAENLVRVLQKYDHEQFYYIGSSSESHLQNIHFSYNMAYGGGGFAISFPLAKELEKMQDRCIQRYPGLYGSDDRIQACMAELGVPLTKEPGFHQVRFIFYCFKKWVSCLFGCRETGGKSRKKFFLKKYKIYFIVLFLFWIRNGVGKNQL